MCNHWYVCEGQHGSTSLGVCKECGAKKEFYNAFPDSYDTFPLRRVKILRTPENNVDLILTHDKRKTLPRITVDMAFK